MMCKPARSVAALEGRRCAICSGRSAAAQASLPRFQKFSRDKLALDPVCGLNQAEMKNCTRSRRSAGPAAKVSKTPKAAAPSKSLLALKGRAESFLGRHPESRRSSAHLNKRGATAIKITARDGTGCPSARGQKKAVKQRDKVRCPNVL
jgi:hypothetical protein